MVASVGLRLTWSAVLVLFAAVGCGGNNNPVGDGSSDAPDARPETAGDTPSGQETGTEVSPVDALEAGSDSGETRIDAGDGGTPNDATDATTDDATDGMPNDSTDATTDDATDGMPAGSTDATTDDATDGPMMDASPEAVDAPPVTDAVSEDAPPPTVMLTVEAARHSIVLERCTNLLPATFPDVAAGAHTITLTASNLSKGTVSDDDDNELPSFDDFVIVHVPVAAGAPASRRLFSLNGVGATANFSLSTVGTVRLMFIDSDASYNEGQATVTLDATGPTATVNATANALPWNSGCSSTPASVGINEDRGHRVTLVASTLSVGGGSQDDYVLLRLPSEQPRYPFRYVILNGVGASVDFTPYLDDSVRAWFITPTAGATGQATLVVTDL